MDLLGKKTERVLMRVTPDMKREVEARAQLEGRPINHQYRVLITFALQHMRSSLEQEIHRPASQPLATSVNRELFAEGEAKELSSTAVNSARPFPPTRVGKRRIA